ncbi:CD209 antigen-like protein 2 [Megalobrama amblycephala]|uniref:CD209 antigen-like protein 2 n=1 Tax=Megalobrama amblycephala TaxID=75352 RepID=UPI0020143855|nr:CD209 antigen-like protein 2 [Megalobrama amblycephala]
MDLDSIYQNIETEDVKNTGGPQIQSRSQDEGQTQKQRGRTCFVWMTVCLGIICVLLLVFIIVQHISITSERDLLSSYKNTAEEFNQTINSLQHKNTELALKKLKLEYELRKLYEHGKGMFFISSESKNWSESRQYCMDRGGDLVIIKNEVKQRYISSLVKERAWIGLTDIQQEGNMKWVDNSILSQGFWEETEPNDSGGEDCIEINPTSPVLNNWNDESCSSMRKWVCENVTSVPASS